MAVSVAQSSKVGISSTVANKISLQAQQYASAEADIVRMTAYSDLVNTDKTLITGTQYYKEILVGQEQDYSDEIKERIVTINIYKDADSVPLFSLNVPRLSADINGKGVPIGTVIIWASENLPQENGIWLECNGQSCAKYPTLVKVLGADTVPDYRGVFLRGLGAVASSHFNLVTHQSDALGVLQGDAIRNITGRMGSDTEDRSYAYSEPITSADEKANFTGPFSLGPSSRWANTYTQNSSLPNVAPDYIDFDASRVVPTAIENRPINRAVRYFIRAA